MGPASDIGHCDVSNTALTRLAGLPACPAARQLPVHTPPLTLDRSSERRPASRPPGGRRGERRDWCCVELTWITTVPLLSSSGSPSLAWSIESHCSQSTTDSRTASQAITLTTAGQMIFRNIFISRTCNKKPVSPLGQSPLATNNLGCSILISCRPCPALRASLFVLNLPSEARL